MWPKPVKIIYSFSFPYGIFSSINPYLSGLNGFSRSEQMTYSNNFFIYSFLVVVFNRKYHVLILSLSQNVFQENSAMKSPFWRLLFYHSIPVYVLQYFHQNGLKNCGKICDLLLAWTVSMKFSQFHEYVLTFVDR